MENVTDKWDITNDSEIFLGYELNSRDDAIQQGVYQYQCATHGGHNTDLFHWVKTGDDDWVDWELSGHKFYIGRKVDFVPHVDAMCVLECIAQDAYDMAGEISEGYLDWSYFKEGELDDLQQSLQKAFDDWVKRTDNEPRFYVVTDVEEIDAIKEIDADDYE